MNQERTNPDRRDGGSDAADVVEDALARVRRGERPAAVSPLDSDLADAIGALTLLEHVATEVRARRPGTTPDRIGDFRILRRVGVGGMAVVYEAIQESLGRRVAVKVLAANEWREEADRERFRREARAAAKLHHSNIVPVYDVGEENGVPFYAMQFIDGPTLRDVIDARRRDGRDPTAGQCKSDARLLARAADALAHAHVLGVLHRDVKPANLLLDADGTPWVADFGLAKPTEESNLTKAGQVVGTARYLAPERFCGQSAPAADIYALGATLYELVTLRPPYDEDDPFKLLAQIRAGQFPRPRAINPNVPPDLETVLLKALSPAPGDRYDSAAAFAADLRRVADNRPVAARRHGPAELTVRWARRNPAWASLAAVLLLGTASLAALSVQVTRERNAAVVAGEKTAEAERGRRRELATSLTSEARQRLASGRLGGRRAALSNVTAARDALPESEWTPDRLAEWRDLAIAALAIPDAIERSRVPGPQNLLDAVAVPDGSGVVAPTAEGPTFYPLDGGPSRTLPAPFASFKYAMGQFSPDGRWYLETLNAQFPVNESQVFVEATVRIWDWPAGRVARTFRTRTPEFGAAVANDVWFVGDEAATRLEEWRPGGMAPARVSPPRYALSRLAVSPSGDRLAVVNNWVGVDILRRSGGTGAWYGAIPFIRDVMWHPDGRHVAFGTTFGRVGVIDANTGTVREFPAHAPSAKNDVHVSPDGRILAVSSLGHGTTLYDWDRAVPLLTVPGRLFAFRPGGEFLVAEAGVIVTYAWDDHPPLRTLPLLAESVSYRPDGAVIAVSGIHGVRLFDAGSLKPVCDLGLDHAGSVAWHPRDGRFAVVGLFSGLTLWAPSADGRSLTRRALAFNREGPQHAGRAVAWTPDGTGLVVGDYRSAVLRHIDAATLSAGSRFVLPRNLHDVVVAPDGQSVIVASRNPTFCARVDAATGAVRRRWHGMLFARYDPSGRQFVLGGESHYTFFDAATDEALATVPRETLEVDYAAATFDPTGRFAAVSLGAGRVGLVDPVTGAIRARLEGPHTTPVLDLHFSPAGTTLAVASLARPVVLWSFGPLRRRLAELGLDWDDRPVVDTTPPPIGPVAVADPFRPRQWAEHWRIKTYLETQAGKFPDAIHAAGMALAACPPDDATYRAALMISRGKAYLNNDAPNAALDDFRAAAAEPATRDEANGLLARTYAQLPDGVGDPAAGLPPGLAAAESGAAAGNAALGLVYLRMESYDRAADRLTRVGGKLTGSAAVVNADALAVARGALGDRPAATAAFAAAREAERAVNVDRLGLFDRAALIRMRDRARASAGNPPK